MCKAKSDKNVTLEKHLGEGQDLNLAYLHSMNLGVTWAGFHLVTLLSGLARLKIENSVCISDEWLIPYQAT